MLPQLAQVGQMGQLQGQVGQVMGQPGQLQGLQGLTTAGLQGLTAIPPGMQFVQLM